MSNPSEPPACLPDGRVSTPPHVWAALQTIGAFLREQGYADVIVAPTGGAAFHRESIYKMIDRYAALALELQTKLNSPETAEFFESARVEAAHQRERWTQDHKKSEADWFWLIGYLSGKALHNPDPGQNTVDKKRHRIITVAAAAANWYRHVGGHVQD